MAFFPPVLIFFFFWIVMVWKRVMQEVIKFVMAQKILKYVTTCKIIYNVDQRLGGIHIGVKCQAKVHLNITITQDMILPPSLCPSYTLSSGWVWI